VLELRINEDALFYFIMEYIYDDVSNILYESEAKLMNRIFLI
jgi:hypothetical protein